MYPLIIVLLYPCIRLFTHPLDHALKSFMYMYRSTTDCQSVKRSTMCGIQCSTDTCTTRLRRSNCMYMHWSNCLLNGQYNKSEGCTYSLTVWQTHGNVVPSFLYLSFIRPGILTKEGTKKRRGEVWAPSLKCFPSFLIFAFSFFFAHCKWCRGEGTMQLLREIC